MNGRQLAQVAGLCVTLAGPALAQTPQPVSGPATLTARLEAGESQTWPLDMDQGTYVTGTLDSGRRAVDLSLVTAAGRDIRALRVEKAGKDTFFFVPPPAATALQLRNHDDQDARITLHLDKVIPPEAQTGAPAPKLLSPEMGRLAHSLRTGGDTRAFWAERRSLGTPMVEPAPTPGHSIVTFLWQGAQKNVRLWGAPAPDHPWLARLGQSDVWYASFEVPDSLRLAYGMAPDVPQFDASSRENRIALLATLQGDPLNRHPVYSDAPDIWSQRSLLELPDAPPQPGMSGPPAPQKGTITSFEFTSDALGNTRGIDIYTPAGFSADDPELVVLVMFDGPAYQSDRAPLPRILDRLIARGQLPPVLAVMIDPLDGEARGRELPPNPAFLNAVADDLLPGIARDLGIPLDRSRTVVAGSSYGGLAANWFVHERPEVFGNAISLSGSFQWSPDGYRANGTPYLSHLWIQSAPRDVRLWMSAGQFEMAARPAEVSILETNRHLRDILRLKNVDVRYREYAGGHDYVIWRGALADGLIDLFAHP